MVASKSGPSLPHIVLKDRTVSYDVLSLIPLSTTERYQVVAFESEPKLLKLAIVHPEALKEGFYVALKDLGKKIEKEIELYQTDSASFGSLLKAYKQGPSTQPAPSAQVPPVAPVTPQPSRPIAPPVSIPPPVSVPKPIPVSSQPEAPVPVPPPHFKPGQPVEVEFLRKIPLVYSKIHRLACVDFQAPSTYWFASDGENRELANSSVEFIENKNRIKGHLVILKKQELDELLALYGHMVRREEEAELQKEKELEAQKEEADKKVNLALPPMPSSIPAEPVPVAAISEPEPDTDEVLSPDLQGAILSTEEARGGLAGLFQKVSQGLHNEKSKASPAKPAELPLPKPPTAAVAPLAPGSLAAPAATIPKPPVPGTEPAKAPVNALSDTGESDLGKLLAKPVESEAELRDHIRKGVIPQIVAAVVSFAIHEKASDIHIEAFNDEVRVRYRVDGQLIDAVKLSPDVHAAMVSRIKILSRLRLDETRIPQDGRFDVNFQNAQVDLRVSVMPTVHGEKVVLRILDKSKGVSSLEELGIEGLAYQNLTKAINRPYGIVLSTGPTGSGKSTSLYAVLNRIATPNVNVVTLEDPVEYEMKGINQSQIRPKIGYTFAEGLRSILRQDPNIIMVGEIRDGETATMATQAALTGHLVLSTLHTNDAAGAIPRLTNMGIEPFLITSSLNVAMGQRLVRKICQSCKSEVNLPQGVKDQISHDLDEIAKISPMDASRIKQPFAFYQGRGCELCGGKGYLGRMGIYEVLNMSDSIEELTLAHASAAAIQEQAQKEGMISMYQDGLLKVISGITTLDEVLRETSNK